MHQNKSQQPPSALLFRAPHPIIRYSAACAAALGTPFGFIHREPLVSCSEENPAALARRYEATLDHYARAFREKPPAGVRAWVLGSRGAPRKPPSRPWKPRNHSCMDPPLSAFDSRTAA